MSKLMLRLKISLAERLSANKLENSRESPPWPYGLGGDFSYWKQRLDRYLIFFNLYACYKRDDRLDQVLDANRQRQVFRMLDHHNEFGRRVLIEPAD